ncbi:hypothetical protein MKW98_003242 [Papaver atlanticum]|uniref:Uncharacterized protein n=1 Tax=Papaver atlanticum TaxID=357466 RepID=A0AAD4SMB7_9MAGN|nr:hypothetical protein MKW98_003242 [Papaver atlanticum]
MSFQLARIPLGNIHFDKVFKYLLKFQWWPGGPGIVSTHDVVYVGVLINGKDYGPGIVSMNFGVALGGSEAGAVA